MAAKATKPTTSTDPEKVVELQHDIRADSFVVSWDGDDDPQNPKNWSELRKWATVTLVATIAFIPYVLLPHNSRDAQKADGRIACSPFASSLIAPPINLVMEEFHSTSNVLSTLVVTIFMLGFAAGPLVISPLSEQYGRNIVFISTVIMHLLFTIACALSTGINMLIVFRFLAGCFGSAPITIGGGTITDIMPQEKRGKAMAIFIMGPTLGPSLGPIIGGYLAQAAGWRWVFWLLAIALGVMTAFTIIFLRETYAPKILARKANRLRKKTGDGRWRSKMPTDSSAGQLLLRAIVRPSKLLVLSPIVLSLSIYMATSYGYLFLLFTTFPTVFQDHYNFSVGKMFLSTQQLVPMLTKNVQEPSDSYT